MAVGLARLFGVSVEEFRAAHWPDRPLHADGPLARLDELTAADALRDIASLLRAHPGPAWLHRRTAAGVYDHETSIAAADAPARFDAGELMDLRDLQRRIPEVRAALARLGSELAVASGYCHAFVAPAGTGVPKHFDNRTVIAVQLVGRKRWTLAPNAALPLPLMPHVAGAPLHALNRRAVADAAELDDPELPAGARAYLLAPGSALFIPCGWWHTTHAFEDSLSLSFGWRSPSWAELFVNTALQELASEPAWRAAAYDVATVRSPDIEAFVRAMQQAIADLRASPPPPEED